MFFFLLGNLISGLAILVNTCCMKTQDHYTKFCAHVTAVATLDKDLVPVTNRYEVIESRMNSFMHGYVLDIPNSYAKNVCVYFFSTAAFFMCLFCCKLFMLTIGAFHASVLFVFHFLHFFSQKKVNVFLSFRIWLLF